MEIMVSEAYRVACLLVQALLLRTKKRQQRLPLGYEPKLPCSSRGLNLRSLILSGV